MFTNPQASVVTQFIQFCLTKEDNLTNVPQSNMIISDYLSFFKKVSLFKNIEFILIFNISNFYLDLNR